jgi:hypothetical protein
MIDSKVFFFHDIFYDTSVNFLCTYPLLYTAGMCVVTYMGVYTYLHGKCFLSALYNDIIWLASPQSTILFVSSRGSSSHAYATSRSSLLHTDLRHTSCRNTMYSVFACAGNTGDSAFAFFGMPMLLMFYFQSTELGRNWTWSAS